MLNENTIASCTTLKLPGDLLGITTESALVFCGQANFIEGGLMLTIVARHNVIDMTGQDFIIELMSKACYNEPYTSEELAVSNMDRSVVPLLDDLYTPGPELARQIVKPPSSAKDVVSKSIGHQSLHGLTLNYLRHSLALSKLLSRVHCPPPRTSSLRTISHEAAVWYYPRSLTYNTDIFQDISEESLIIVAAELQSQLDPEKNDVISNTHYISPPLG
ncbi:uncharacterized protein N7500_009688 [Penicillium coprophilum]|uniref:uncharacterized protein n=1 Tax=Penicillium coprophilum TaxID=36646 RepID=UPI0023A29509|nr:uncharacterized protein N7500_009688 [Penicillium coprophilum]KAJ5154249.1 hypothetical protein N7500_009688 [Penicillium coprophilum]